MSKDKPALIVRNKTATRNYKLGDSFQAGIVLEGWEVKSLRNGKVDIKDSYVTFKNDEAWLIGAKIDPPASLKNFNADPTRSRKLLLHKKEIYQLQKLKGEKGLTVILTSIYWKENHIKCDISTGKGKKLYDQRQDIKKRDWERDQGRILKNSRK
ncbi:MAG: SsrA-binding protein SmpB [Proteobacteria bacterium]|jgi:SsrA-binding protein|nr:SsrA-binding protein SmpB [Pseudomonadota bacterium]MDA1038034.1 SsrA-binding protein SmpB [Pseudomonadota bacterium]NCW58774.1 SsrA-binding protein SmpB [Pseudomonadota bacterium]NCX10148.1 SsrA-binding protein SmpB [Pseudomonadota bacterium]NCX25088.1 SsrA-binding protein SmpB [Pseudomonadota bacterium]